ncbi:hypothetical protein B0T11DRAFT_84244 [Plectosphaerella cucumerina]|uniref:Uncharacterized protein n=1 Tax=Plectosphaerella cucumerina TaxID=40658 RepID=A0A8K0X376_9PEZI|nr:hypothetical protein B0T11DRAFT_84244 [Plectosphaerella cucumerina]
MDFIDAKYSAGAAGLSLQAIQKQTMMEPTSRMDRLYNSVNSFHDGFRPGDEPPPKPKHGKRSSASKRRPPKWYHKQPDNHLTRLGAGTHWPMPEVVELDDAPEITEKWRLKLYECFHELDMFVRTRFDHAAFAIRSENVISDEALFNMVEEAWEATTKVEMIKDVFHGTTLPDNPKSGLEAWSEIFQGFSEDSPVPIPSYSLVSEGSHDKFSQFKFFAHRHKVAFQIPALNLEKLTDRRLLLMLIVNRTLETPPYFARIDWEAMQIGRSGRLLSPPFCNGAFMSFFQGRDPNRDWYESGVESECRYLWGGRPESYEIRWHEKPKRLQHAAHGRFLRTDEPHRDSEAWKEDTNKALNQRGLVYGWGEGLLVLQAQTAIYRFCLELCHLAEKRNSDKAKFKMVPLLPAWPWNKKGSWNKNACIKYGKAVRDQNAEMFPEQRMCHFPDILIENAILGNYRMEDQDATFSPDAIRLWRLDSDKRIRSIGGVWAQQLDQTGIEADYQYGCRPTRQPPRSHYEHLSDRCAALHMYLRQRTLLVLESPKEFIAMCRDGYNCHYGWIPAGAGGKDNNQHLLEHMVSTEFNAKKAMANDVIRRCLRFLVFGVEISCALEQLLQELKELMCPGADTPSGQNIEASVFVHPLDDAKTHRAYLNPDSWQRQCSVAL